MQEYLDLPRDELLLRYGLNAESLSETYEELALSLNTELRCKCQAYLDAHPEVTVTGRTQLGTINALEATCSATDLRCKIDALREEQKFLLLLLEK